MTALPLPKTAIKPIVEALRGKARQPVPFWLMRQAGRYLPEYRELRKKAGSFLNLCFNPDWAAEITLQPIRRFDMDAAILFSDILVVPYALGQELDFVEGEGPRLGMLKVDRLSFDPSRLAPVYETLKKLRQQLAPEKTLIGFAGAPWTVACYMVDGQGGGEFGKTKKFAFENPEGFGVLIDKIVDATVLYLSAQAKSGADVVQIFDSWAGLLPEPYFTRWVIKPVHEIIRRLKMEHPHLPVIAFPRGAGELYKKYAAEVEADGIGIDTATPLSWAVKEFGEQACLQGNLDPEVLLVGGKVLEDAALSILDAAKGRPFIFNLGHGVIKETPPEHVAQLAKLIRGHAG